MINRWWWGGPALALVAACGRDSGRHAEPPPSSPQSGRERVVFLGTSLTAGNGLDASEAYPALIQQKIDSAALPFEAVNAGVSGETSAGALRRIDWLLKEPPAVLVIETGANDGLRGQDVDSLEANIQAIVDRANALTPRPRIVLVGMRMLSNYGADYIRRFAGVYPELAKRNGLPLVPFLLEGVAGVDSLNQPDQIHPTAAGQRVVAETVWRTLEPVLRSDASARSVVGQSQDLRERRDGGFDLPSGVVVVG
jgi:acyl-CoA thioesterase-1